MRFARSVILFFSLFSNSQLCAQQISTPIPHQLQSVQKDATALTVLGQMAAESGWRLASVPRDVVVEGNVTRYSGDTLDAANVINATFKLSGTTQSQALFVEDGNQT